jgi:hypothetical protein
LGALQLVEQSLPREDELLAAGATHQQMGAPARLSHRVAVGLGYLHREVLVVHEHLHVGRPFLLRTLRNRRTLLLDESYVREALAGGAALDGQRQQKRRSRRMRRLDQGPSNPLLV